MSVMGDMWIGDHERVADDYTRNAQKHGVKYAEEQARAALKSLGFDQHEIEDQIMEIAS